MKDIPPWFYKLLFVVALIVGAFKVLGTGRLSWLPHGGDGEVYMEIAEWVFLGLGFGTRAKVKQPTEVIELPPEIRSGEGGQ